MRIGLIPEGLLTWQGGREFFRLATTGLRLAARAEDRLQVVYPAGSQLPSVPAGPHRQAAPPRASLVDLDTGGSRTQGITQCGARPPRTGFRA